LEVHTWTNGHPLRTTVHAGDREAAFDGERLIWNQPWDNPETQKAVETAWLNAYEQRCTEVIKDIMERASGGRVADLRQLAAAIEGEIRARAGEGLVVWDRNGQCEVPPGGAVLEMRDAIEDYSYDEWYPTMAAAKAALARASGSRQLSENGCYVDLTAAGCNQSYALVRVNK
jgi:hypothetical protein